MKPDKSYIASLLMKDHRQLDLYEIAEIQEYVGLEWVNKHQEADFYEEHYEIKWAELRIKFRTDFLMNKDIGKVTEAMLDDAVHASAEWREFIDLYIKARKDDNIYKQKMNKWNNFYSAKMSLEATNRRIVL
jgi:hypothetical protein